MKKKIIVGDKTHPKGDNLFLHDGGVGYQLGNNLWDGTFVVLFVWSGGYRRSWSIWLVILSEISQNCIYCFVYGGCYFYSDGEICPGKYTAALY